MWTVFAIEAVIALVATVVFFYAAVRGEGK